MIPDFVDIGAPWSVLPPGTHVATLEEVRTRFAVNPRRKALFRGLARACRALRASGCGAVYIDGSFVTDKPLPGDYDACWDPAHVDLAKLDPIFQDFKNARARQKAEYGGEFFPSVLPDGTTPLLDYFQADKANGAPKGIIIVPLGRTKGRRPR